NAVDHHQFACFGLQLLQTRFQCSMIFVRKPEELALGEQTAFDDARMVALVSYYVFAFADQGTYDAKINLETGAIKQNRLFVDQLCQGCLQLQMNIERSVEEPRTGASRSIFSDRGSRCLLDLRMVCEPQIAVRSQH